MLMFAIVCQQRLFETGAEPRDMSLGIECIPPSMHTCSAYMCVAGLLLYRPLFLKKAFLRSVKPL